MCQCLPFFGFINVLCFLFVFVTVLSPLRPHLFMVSGGAALAVCCLDLNTVLVASGRLAPLPWCWRRQPTLMTQEDQCRVSLTEESEERLLNILLFQPLCGAADARQTQPHFHSVSSSLGLVMRSVLTCCCCCLVLLLLLLLMSFCCCCYCC